MISFPSEIPITETFTITYLEPSTVEDGRSPEDQGQDEAQNEVSLLFLHWTGNFVQVVHPERAGLYVRIWLTVTSSTRDLDQVYADLHSPKHLSQHQNSKPAEDLPGLGQWYCIECAKWFEGENSLIHHRRGKVHKRRYDPYECDALSLPIALYLTDT